MSAKSVITEKDKPASFLRMLLPSRGRSIKQEIPPEVAPQEPPADSKKILIVDDDAIIRKTLAFKLKSAGYRVAAAVDGADAIRAIREEIPDLIVMDINFPPDVGSGGSVAWDGFLLRNWLRGVAEA